MDAARDTLIRPLSSAIDDIEELRPIDALITLLAAWRSDSAVELADAIDLLSNRISHVLPPPGRTSAAFAAIAKRGHVADVTRLAARLLMGTLQARADRLTLLAGRPRDPRLTRPLLAIVMRWEKLAINLATFPIWGRIFETFASIADERARSRLLALQSSLKTTNTTRFDRMFASGVASVINALASPPRILSQAEVEAVSDLVAAIHAAPDACFAEVASLVEKESASDVTAGIQEDDLLAAIYADPESDAPRHVYADWLLERNDPRGKFIALQLQAAAPYGKFVGHSHEANELLEQHERMWLGPAAPLVSAKTARFKRGFLSSAQLCFPTSSGDSEGEGERHARLGALPIWRTLETATGTILPILNPHNRALRSVSLMIAAFPDIVALPHKTYVKELRIHGTTMGDQNRSRLLTPANDHISLTDLRRVSFESDTSDTATVFSVERLRWFLEHSLFSQLERLDLHARNRYARESIPLGQWTNFFEAIARTPGSSLNELRIVTGAGPHFTLRRRDAEVNAQLKLEIEIELVVGTDDQLLWTQLTGVASPGAWEVVVVPAVDAKKTHAALGKRLVKAFPEFKHLPLADPR